MPGSEPVTTARILRGFEDHLRKYPGINFGMRQLLEDVGLPDLDLEGEPDPISLNSFADLLELAAIRTRDQCFGMHLAKNYPAGGTGVFGFVMLNAPDLRTMIVCLTRFVKLLVDVELTFKEKEGVAEISMYFGPGLVVPHKQMSEFWITLFVSRVRRLLGDKWCPNKVEFTYPEPNSAGEYEEMFGKNLTFKAQLDRMFVPTAMFRQPSSAANARLFTTLRSVAEKELTLLAPSKDVVDRLGTYILENIAMKGVELETAAKSVGLTSRQLQSELQRRGTSFENELALVRQRLATRYLRDTDLPMTEIALMLGYSELSAFTRAAKSWFSMPPSEKRTQLRAAKVEW